MKIESEKHTKLIADGFCVFEQVLEETMLASVRAASNRVLDAQPAEHFAAQKSTGSMISVYEDPFFAELVAYPPALNALAALGFPKPRWSSGFVISKPPGSPALFWHQDWACWDDPSSYTDTPQQLFLMYYLVDTDIHNGCLRVIKGSHRQRHPMHDAVSVAHTDELRNIADPDHPAYQPVADEVVVPVKAGDVVIGDARLLHGSYGNQSDRSRTVITLWYHPTFDAAPECIQADVSQWPKGQIESWPASAQELIQALIPTYNGAVAPNEWNRTPGDALK